MKVTLPDLVGADGIFIDGDWVESKDQDPSGDVRLIQLADVGDGEFLDKSARFLTLQKAASLRCTYLRPGDLLVARMPDPIGRACIFPQGLQPSVTVVDVCIVRPDTGRVWPRWLLHKINSDSFRRGIGDWITGTTRQRISRGNLSKIEFDLPPLEEQRRVAAILDKADALRQKRKRAIALIDTLTQSIFIEMFGKAQPSWSEDTIEAIGSSIRTGPFGSQLLHSEFVEEGIAVLGIDNAVQNEFVWGKPRFITDKKYASLKRYKVLPGDVLITIMGTIGRCAVVPDDVGEAINTKHLCCITPDTSRVLPDYLKATFLGHPEVLRQLGAQSKGAIMAGLNMGIIKSLKIPIPPIAMQETFARAVAAISASSRSMAHLHSAADGLFASLQHRAFSGQL